MEVTFSMPTLTNDMMRSIILDHYSNPLHKHAPEGEGYQMMHMHSDNCIDDLNIYLKVENDIVKSACFEGVACAISTASTDIMCEVVVGKTVKDAMYAIAQYNHMIHEEPFDEDVLDEAIAFINTSKQAARIRCATIGWTAAENILKK